MRIKSKLIVHVYISLIVLAFPLWTGLSGYGKLGYNKFMFFAVATAACLLLLAVASVIQKSFRFKLSIASVSALLFIIACALSWAFSDLPRASMLLGSRYDGLLFLILLAVSFLIVLNYGEPNGVYIYMLGLSCGICSLIAIMQIWGLNPFSLYPAGMLYKDSGLKYSGVFLGTIGNTNLLSSYYALCIPAFIWLILDTDNPNRFWLLLPSCLAMYVAIAAGMRSFLLALTLSLVILFLYYIKTRFPEKKYYISAIGLIFASSVLFLVSVFVLDPNDGVLADLGNILHGRISDSLGSHRLLIWKEALKLAVAGGILGYGPASYSHLSQIRFSRYVPETGTTLVSYVDNAHSELLNYLVQTGALSLVFYLLIFASSLCRIKSRGKTAFGFSVISYFISALFGLALPPVLPIMWIFMGLMCTAEGDFDAKAFASA
ncbi:MAG: O-antigen ligase family protein [Ruminococcaceae bacterium]|nr:O-antigen ligase family protein [Oscillospiraceae bacterium]